MNFEALGQILSTQPSKPMDNLTQLVETMPVSEIVGRFNLIEFPVSQGSFSEVVSQASKRTNTPENIVREGIAFSLMARMLIDVPPEAFFAAINRAARMRGSIPPAQLRLLYSAYAWARKYPEDSGLKLRRT